MNTIQCPVCKQTLEGEFQMTDMVKCPSCGTSFIPERLVPLSQKTSRLALPTAFSPKHYELAQRPKEIVWVVAILVGSYMLMLSMAFLRFVIVAMSDQWNLVDVVIRPIIGRFPQYFLTVFFAWKLFCGKAWARTLFNWLLPIELVVGGILMAGATSNVLIKASLDGADSPDYSLRILPILSLFIVVCVFGTPLYLINRKAVRAWFATATVKNAPPKPHWWIWSIVYYVAIVVLTMIFVFLAPNATKSSSKTRSEDASHTTDTSATKELALSWASENPPKPVLQSTVQAKELQIAPLPGGETMRFRGCPAGTFMMGSPDWEDGRCEFEVRHHVTLTKGFWIGETEVTQGQWKALMDNETVCDLARKMLQDDNEYDVAGAAPRSTQRSWLGYAREVAPTDICYTIDDASPIYFVSWVEAARFCARLTAQERKRGRIPQGYVYRLPTAAEWEYACRAGTTTSLPNGTEIIIRGKNNAPTLDSIAWYGGNSSVGFSGNGCSTKDWADKQYPGGNAGPRKVGKKEPNNWGIYDMIGNVMEWCMDWSAPMSNESTEDPVGPSTGSYRILRGGDWGACAEFCRPASFTHMNPNIRNNRVGFRVVLAPELEL